MANNPFAGAAAFRRVRTPLTVIAATALLLAAGNAAETFDTKDPAYAARAADMVAKGRILKQCLPGAATAPAAEYKPIAAPSDELIAAATREGQLVVNSGISDDSSIAAYKAAFEARYPAIRLSVVSGASATLEERFLADHAAGNQKVDAVITNKLSWAERAFKEKALLPLDQSIAGFFAAWPGGSWQWNTESGSTAPAFYRALGIAYNSDLVKGNLIPRQFKDLANPAFKDQLLGMDPEASVTFARVWKHIMDSVDEETMRAIGRNMVKKPLYSDIQVAAQVLGAGGAMVIMEMGGNVANTMRANGAPVEMAMPDTATGTQYALGVAAKAPHPNAGKLFAHWLYSAEGQWVMSCAADAGTVAYPGNGTKTFVPIEAVSRQEIARIKQLLGI